MPVAFTCPRSWQRWKWRTSRSPTTKRIWRSIPTISEISTASPTRCVGISRSDAVFPPPQLVQTEIFATLPDAFRKPRRTTFSDVNRGGQPIHSFLEGPSFDQDGNLYV